MIALDNGDKIRGDAPVINEVDYLIFGFVGTVATQLADGQLPAAIGDLYTAPADGIGVSSIVLVNTGAVARAVNLYLTPNAGVARRLTPEDYSLAAGYVLITDGKSIHNFPSGAATLAEQQIQTTALQLIDNLVAALESVATDRLQVRGEDQLFSYSGMWSERVRDLNAALGDNTLVAAAVPAGEVWVLTHVAAANDVSVCTRIILTCRLAPTYENLRVRNSPPIFETVDWQGWKPLEEGWDVYATFIGCVAGDDIYVSVGGFKMTLET